MHRCRVLLFLWEKRDCYNSRVASKAAFAADLQECGGAFFLFVVSRTFRIFGWERKELD